MTRIFTLERGGLSDIHLSATSPVSPNDGKPAERSAQWGEHQVKDITNIHPEEEVFLLGNLYALNEGDAVLPRATAFSRKLHRF